MMRATEVDPDTLISLACAKGVTKKSEQRVASATRNIMELQAKIRTELWNIILRINDSFMKVFDSTHRNVGGIALVCC